jgi:hypothetical protein
MGKSYRQDARNERWRKQKQHKQRKQKPSKSGQIAYPPSEFVSEPVDNEIGGLNDYAYGM